MRGENDQGTIRLLSDKKRNKRYQVLAPNKDGRISLGVYSTKAESRQVRERFLENPKSHTYITFFDLYIDWKSKTTITKNDVYAFRYCSPIYQKRFICITEQDLLLCIHKGYYVKDNKRIYVSSSMSEKVKSLLNRLYDFAIKKEIVTENISRTINQSIGQNKKKISRNRIPQPYTDQEIDLLWRSTENPYYSYFTIPLLICIYHGITPSQIVKVSNIDRVNKTILVPIDREAQYTHPIPIHPRFTTVVDNYLMLPRIHGFFVIDEFGRNMTYDKFRNRFIKFMKLLKLNHKLADIRETFITKAKISNMDPYILEHFLEVYNRQQPFIYDQSITTEMRKAINELV